LEVTVNFSFPPEASRASGIPALKSRKICRCFTIYQNRVVHFESHLELMVFFMLSRRAVSWSGDILEIIP
jgi:hypothetical protein